MMNRWARIPSRTTPRYIQFLWIVGLATRWLPMAVDRPGMTSRAGRARVSACAARFDSGPSFLMGFG